MSSPPVESGDSGEPAHRPVDVVLDERVVERRRRRHLTVGTTT
jgi:hypothetical protein